MTQTPGPGLRDERAHAPEPFSTFPAFLPSKLVNEKGLVLANSTSLRVDEAGQGVFAVGDVSDQARWGIMDIYSAVPIVMSNLKRDLMAPAGEKGMSADSQSRQSWMAICEVTIRPFLSRMSDRALVFGDVDVLQAAHRRYRHRSEA